MGQDYIKLKCPSCGASLKLKKEAVTHYCPRCGSKNVSPGSESKISSEPSIQFSEQVYNSVDKAESELAIKRLSNEIDELKIIYRRHVSGPNIFNIIIGISVVFMVLSISVYIIGLVTNNAGYEAFPCVAFGIISGFTIIL